ncbi:MAG: Holliday junction resolvase-like protein [Desulfobacteraceae bacterium]|jgi:predicted Holliday junction resolvase-like endonuclease
MSFYDWCIVLAAIAALMCGISGVVVTLISRKFKLFREEAEGYKKKYERELHLRKSSEIRLGKIGENLTPFVEHWPWDPKNFRFLGNPVDGIQFNEDEIIFVEIKTGKARLSKSQRKCRDIVKAGNVRFATFKITESGTNLHMVNGDE